MRQVRDNRHFIFVVLSRAKLTTEMTELDCSRQCNLAHSNSTCCDTNTTSAEHTNGSQESDARVFNCAAVSAVLSNVAELVQQIGTRNAHICERNARVVETVKTPVMLNDISKGYVKCKHCVHLVAEII